MTLKSLKLLNLMGKNLAKGCPYDNAVAEATFKIIKTEFVNSQIYKNLDQLKY